MSTKWFLYCADAHTNEVVSTTLNGLQTTGDFKKHECADGKERMLYEVPDYSFAARMWRSQKQLKVKLTIFRNHDDGKPDKWAFPEKSPKGAPSPMDRKKSPQRATAIHQRKRETPL